MENEEIRQKFEIALNQFTERIKQDPNILAIYVAGSYNNGTLWEHSDIDMLIVTNDTDTRSLGDSNFLVLLENDVCIQAWVFTRSQFRQRLQSFIHGDITHHITATSKLIFSKDKAITDINRNTLSVAERDKELSVLIQTEFLIGELHKAKKTLYIENNIIKCFRWVFWSLEQLANVILLMNNIIPGRDVLTQIKEVKDEPITDLVKKIMTDGNNKENLEFIIKEVEKFLLSNKHHIFKPLFNFISEFGDSRTVTDIDTHFRKALGRSFITFVESYEWLSAQGDLMKVTSPKRIATKSRTTVNELSLYYVGGEMV
ncbi:MAG: nucleotidyltransferase domain-containing protein [Candidatus Hodarchaeales archaeon]|jgi:predicted nucleotidyltransferase